MSEDKPKRRWIRPSLEMWLVLIPIAVLLIGWTAYHLNWIQQRHEFYAKHRKMPHNPPPRLRDDAELPWALKLFGERREQAIWVDEADADRAQELFPEATVVIDY
jgi:hypothetical protein